MVEATPCDDLVLLSQTCRQIYGVCESAVQVMDRKPALMQADVAAHYEAIAVSAFIAVHVQDLSAHKPQATVSSHAVDTPSTPSGLPLATRVATLTLQLQHSPQHVKGSWSLNLQQRSLQDTHVTQMRGLQFME